MEFGTVLIVVAVLAVIVAVISFWGSGRIYSALGRSGGLTMEHDAPDHRAASVSEATSAQAREEIRQMLDAKSARREARGEAPLDVDAELEALTRQTSGHDAALRDEVRQLVIARNERRMRRGEKPLDVELEVDRQLRDLEG